MSSLILFGGSRTKKRSGLRKPKLKKFPKTPRSVNIAVLSNYAKKCESIGKENASKMSDYNRKLKVRSDIKAKVIKIKEHIKTMKGKY